MPRRSILADDVYAVLREGLVTRRILPGSRLNLDQLARDLNVSNTPVRQALARLESEGLVTKEPYRGFTVSPLLDARGIEELYEYRQFVEAPTAANAARRRSDDNLAVLEDLCDPLAIDALLSAPASADELGKRDVELHCAIARAAGNEMILRNLEQIFARESPYNLHSLYTGPGTAAVKAWQEHRAIVAAIAAGDPDAAERSMRTHLRNGLQRLRGSLG